ncbi:MAG: hypothetical protein ACHP7N_11360 [Caulobacterales bacterium]
MFFLVAATAAGVMLHFIGTAVNLGLAVLFAICAPAIWWAADVFRQFAMPTFYFGSGAIDMAKKRLFWMVGPQTIGVLTVFGVFAALGLETALMPSPFWGTETSNAPTPVVAANTASPATSLNNDAAPIADTNETTNVATDGPPSPPPDPAPFSSDGQAAGSIADLPASEAELFAKYRTDVYTGPITVPDPKGTPPAFVASYFPKIKAGVESGPNFAGTYSLTTFACGVGCLVGMATDVTNGAAANLPRSGPNAPQLSIEFVKDSKLLRARWAAHLDAGGAVTSCAHEDFVLGDDGFQSLGRIDAPGPCAT